jgi:hypothetical protein
MLPDLAEARLRPPGQIVTMGQAMGLATTADHSANGLYRPSEPGTPAGSVAGRGGASAHTGGFS